jgi:hypothetical protein
MFAELPFAVAAAKGQQQQFLTRLNAGIAAIRADGTWEQINDRLSRVDNHSAVYWPGDSWHCFADWNCRSSSGTRCSCKRSASLARSRKPIW